MSDFSAIAGHPGYSISLRGEVLSDRSGKLLDVDKRGRVKLYVAGKYKMFFLAELFRLSGHMPGDTKAEKAELENRLRWARKVNGHLLALIEDLRKARPARPAPGKSRAVRMEEKFLEPLDFETMDGWEG